MTWICKAFGHRYNRLEVAVRALVCSRCAHMVELRPVTPRVPQEPAKPPGSFTTTTRRVVKRVSKSGQPPRIKVPDLSRAFDNIFAGFDFESVDPVECGACKTPCDDYSEVDGVRRCIVCVQAELDAANAELAGLRAAKGAA